MLPRPIFDLHIDADGEVRTVTKTHDLAFETLQWLVGSNPDVLIIAVGWDGVVRPQARIRALDDRYVRILKNREAIRLYNDFRRSGKRVALHYHSTC